MCGEIKDMNEFLEIVNACISHELRNPLNSIIAQNFLKKIMYTNLRAILDSL
jgi:signal transduction histidine kinase